MATREQVAFRLREYERRESQLNDEGMITLGTLRLALRALDTERVRRFAETQRADRERTLRIAAEAKLPSEGEWDALTYCVKVAGGQGAEEDALVAGSWLGHIEARRAVAERATQDVVTGQELAELRGRAELVEVLEEDVERLRADRDAVLAERDEARYTVGLLREMSALLDESRSRPYRVGVSVLGVVGEDTIHTPNRIRAGLKNAEIVDAVIAALDEANAANERMVPRRAS